MQRQAIAASMADPHQLGADLADRVWDKHTPEHIISIRNFVDDTLSDSLTRTLIAGHRLTLQRDYQRPVSVAEAALHFIHESERYRNLLCEIEFPEYGEAVRIAAEEGKGGLMPTEAFGLSFGREWRNRLDTALYTTIENRVPYYLKTG
jgi:hypothetical protein